MLTQYKIMNKEDMKLLRENTTHCELSGEPINKPVIDHMHIGDAKVKGINEAYDGRILGCISNSANIMLGFLYKEAKELNMDIHEYINKIHKYIDKPPMNKVYISHPADVRQHFKELSINDKRDYIEYHFGIESLNYTDDTLNRELRRLIKEKYTN